MTSLASLSDWNAEYGDEDYTEVSQNKERFRLETDICYPVTIRGATLCKSQLGDVQIALDLDVRNYETQEVVAQVKDWISLPFQPITDMGKDKQMVKMLTMIRRNTLSTILNTVDPPRFCLGKPHDDEQMTRTWYSWDDENRELSRQEIEDRKVACNREVLKYAEECHAMLENSESCPLEGWSGTELYHSKKENKRNPKYPYSRYHTDRAFGIPTYGMNMEQRGGANDVAPF